MRLRGSDTTTSFQCPQNFVSCTYYLYVPGFRNKIREQLPLFSCSTRFKTWRKFKWRIFIFIFDLTINVMKKKKIIGTRKHTYSNTEEKTICVWYIEKLFKIWYHFLLVSRLLPCVANTNTSLCYLLPKFQFYWWQF